MSGLHATAVVIGEAGVLLRGPSGAGKSLFALALIGRARARGGFAALVADDRVWLEAVNGRLIARGAPELAGLCERRGEGLVETPHEASAALRLIVDLGAAPRMPEAADRYETLGGVALARLRLDLSPGLDEGVSAVTSALQRVANGAWAKNVNDDAVFA